MQGGDAYGYPHGVGDGSSMLGGQMGRVGPQQQMVRTDEFP